MAEPAPFRPARAIEALGPAFYDPVEPARFPRHDLRFRNDRHAARVGLGTLADSAWTEHFGAFKPLPGSLDTPLALRYHGHQFRVYNPDIGDGRGFLFAQLYDDRGRLLDLGTKGSGQTPYSRFGDGRLTLKGGVREVLATEMLEALGVDTSKSFSLIETGESLTRNDEPSPTRAAVLVRLSHSHIRYGTFQRLAALGLADDMQALVSYCIEHFIGGAHADDHAALMDFAMHGAARLAASWTAAGFVHGVLNTDNINITAESFDYGPWRFAPQWDAGFTAAYFDHGGLYAFGRQAEALQWNLHQLALALRLVAEPDSLIPALRAFPERFEDALAAAMMWRLGLLPSGDGAHDRALADALQAALVATDAGIDRFFFDWRGGRLRSSSGAGAAAYDAAAVQSFADMAGQFQPVAGALDHPYWSDGQPCSMHIDEVEHIWSAIADNDDWQPFNAKIAAVRRMGEAYSASASPR